MHASNVLSAVKFDGLRFPVAVGTCNSRSCRDGDVPTPSGEGAEVS